jgi:L-asparagine transporter-like permease
MACQGQVTMIMMVMMIMLTIILYYYGGDEIRYIIYTLLSAWWFGTWLLFSISYIRCHPSHSSELHHFSKWLLHHRAASYQPLLTIINR